MINVLNIIKKLIIKFYNYIYCNNFLSIYKKKLLKNIKNTVIIKNLMISLVYIK